MILERVATHNYSVLPEVIEVDNPTTIIKAALTGQGNLVYVPPLVEGLLQDDGKLHRLDLPDFVVVTVDDDGVPQNSVAESQYQQVWGILN